MRIALLSDTHMAHAALDVPEADVVIHAGDACNRGTLEELRHFAAFFAALPHRTKICIAGNHDWPFEREPALARALFAEVFYLQDSAVEVDGVRFYGTPWQPEFMDWAFNLPRGAPLAEKWAQIPDDVDVLVTHAPPRGFGDATFTGDVAGCDDLLARVAEVRPRLHVYGHIHEGYGLYRNEHTTFANASNCAVDYALVNAPLLIELTSKGVRRL